MKIKENYVSYNSTQLKCGDVFKYDSTYYMFIESYGTFFKAIDLEYGRFCRFTNDPGDLDDITLVDVELVVLGERHEKVEV